MKDVRNQRIIDGELVLMSIENKLVYGVVFKETCYVVDSNANLVTYKADTERMVKLSVPTGVEISIRKEILQYVSNSDYDKVAIDKAAKICGKKKMEVTPFIQSVANCVAMNISNKGPYRFKSRDTESIKYAKLYSKDIAEYISNIVNKKLKVTVINSELVVEIIE